MTLKSRKGSGDSSLELLRWEQEEPEGGSWMGKGVQGCWETKCYDVEGKVPIGWE